MNIPFTQTPNYATGPTKKLVVVLHLTLGAYNGAVSWLCNGNRPNRTSAHYVIGRNEGENIQLVKNTDIAWHAGNVSNPNDRAKKVMLKNLDGTYVNPNQYCIGIELAAGYDVDQDGTVEPNESDITEWQYKALAELVQSLSADVSLGFILDEKNIIIHGDIADYKEKPEIVRTNLLARLFPNRQPSKDSIKSQIISLINQL
ncbi:MAG: N-acetylmuramoyl-L-alanine amidase [Candidatus Nomurabacteria bacterium]|nr:N-acetylmuramoyl-L-alanine amidase [Candidatus Nomurabacteria bacterium]MCX6788437.1 N-acetylmuramoyl-L-alanine amidase [Candidatus Jorgensenbacteria bacterium]